MHSHYCAHTRACLLAGKFEEALQSAENNYNFAQVHFASHEAHRTAILFASLLFTAERFDQAGEVVDEVIMHTCPVNQSLYSYCSGEYPRALMLGALISLQKGEAGVARTALDSAAKFTSAQPAVFAATFDQSLLLVNASLLRGEGRHEESFELASKGLQWVKQAGQTGTFFHCRFLELQLDCATELGWSTIATEIASQLQAASEEHQRRNDWFIFREGS